MHCIIVIKQSAHFHFGAHPDAHQYWLLHSHMRQTTKDTWTCPSLVWAWSKVSFITLGFCFFYSFGSGVCGWKWHDLGAVLSAVYTFSWCVKCEASRIHFIWEWLIRLKPRGRSAKIARGYRVCALCVHIRVPIIWEFNGMTVLTSSRSPVCNYHRSHFHLSHSEPHWDMEAHIHSNTTV